MFRRLFEAVTGLLFKDDDSLGPGLLKNPPDDVGRPRNAAEATLMPKWNHFAVRVGAVRAVGNFEVKLGRKGEKLLAGEEGELCLRLEEANWEIHYTPTAVIHHRATANRLTRRFILRRAFNHGRSQYLLESLHSFESGLYLPWSGILWSCVRNGLRLNWNLPYFKFLLFRVGYQYQRFQSRRG